MKIMVIVDCQKDFIDGSLGTPEAQAMIPRLAKKIENEPENTIFVFTQDTHYSNYLFTREGKNLPIEHCIFRSEGWKIDARLKNLFSHKSPRTIQKETFGSTDLMEFLENLCINLIGMGFCEKIDEIEFVGLCTDICVISNALMAKAHFFETALISCDATCCAGSTPEKHKAALEVMKSCQIVVKE